MTHIVDLLCQNPRVYAKLEQELKDKFPDGIGPQTVSPFSEVQALPYLNAVIAEVFRYRPTVALGLPRVVPEGGATVAGRFYKEGTVLSCPTYSIHHNAEVFTDPDTFYPERWLDTRESELEKYLIPFSTGPRACIGRNVSEL